MAVGLGLLASVMLNGVMPFFSSYVREALQLSLGNVGVLVALSMVGRIVGALCSSLVTDRIGRRQSFYLAIGLVSVACLGLGLPRVRFC